MGHFLQYVPGVASSRFVGLWFGTMFLIVACDGSPVGVDGPETFRVTEGACGDVVFVENLGRDLASAIEALEERKIEQLGVGQVVLDTYRLDVVDRNGMTPTEEFYAVRVLNADTRLLAHSVVEVLTSDGDLFHLEWCPD